MKNHRQENTKALEKLSLPDQNTMAVLLSVEEFYRTCEQQIQKQLQAKNLVEDKSPAPLLTATFELRKHATALVVNACGAFRSGIIQKIFPEEAINCLIRALTITFLLKKGSTSYPKAYVSAHASLCMLLYALRILARDGGTPQFLRQLSPKEICPDSDWLARRVQCEMQLLAYFGEKEILQVFRTDSPMRGRPGVNLRPLGEWLDKQNELHPDHLGEIVRPNPFTGEQGETNEGKPSYIARGCLSNFRHMVFEFDHLALEDQCRFWAGFIKANALPLVSLVYSGNKSIHGVIRVDAPDLPTWNHYRAKILSLYGTDPDPRYRFDPQALHPSPEPASPESSANQQAKSRNCSG